VTAPVGKVEKYARRERERRFLLGAVPDEPAPVRTAQITDLYVTSTRLRLRRSVERTATDQVTIYKFTQKLPEEDGAPGLITTIYLSAEEYAALSVLPGSKLTKTRLSIPPFGVDIFDAPLDGLFLAEAEFDSDATLAAFEEPTWSVAEVTVDPRFRGGRLASTGADELRSWLSEFGIGADVGSG
jgi:CYTH domain-containing protein